MLLVLEEEERKEVRPLLRWIAQAKKYRVELMTLSQRMLCSNCSNDMHPGHPMFASCAALFATLSVLVAAEAIFLFVGPYVDTLSACKTASVVNAACLIVSLLTSAGLSVYIRRLKRRIENLSSSLLRGG